MPSSLPDISWRSSAAASSNSSRDTAPASDDPDSHSAGSFHSIFAQAASSPSSDPVTTTPSANPVPSNAAVKPQGQTSSTPLPSVTLTSAGSISQATTDAAPAANAKGAVPAPAGAVQGQPGPNPPLTLMKSLVRTASMQRAGKAETDAPVAQAALAQANAMPAAGNIPPGLASDQFELPSNQAASPAGDKSSSLALGLSSVAPSAGESTAPATGFSSLKDLSGAAFAMHITAAATNQASANQGGAGQGSAGQNNANQGSGSQGNAPEVVPFASLSTPTDTNSASKPSSAATSGQPSVLNSTGTVLVTTPAWLSAESTLPASQTASSSPAISTSVEVDGGGSEDAAGAPQTVRTVQVQLAAGEGQGRVDVRLVEHAGGLSVSVRASDSTLTKGLQDNLPDLTARLAAEKYQTHTFIPAASEAAGGGSSSSSSEHPAGQSQDQPGSRSFSQGGDGSSRQKDGQPADQDAAWWRQLAALGKLSSAVSQPASDSPLSTGTNPAANL